MRKNTWSGSISAPANQKTEEKARASTASLPAAEKKRSALPAAEEKNRNESALPRPSGVRKEKGTGLPQPAGERKEKGTGLPQPAGEKKWEESGLPQAKRPEDGRSGFGLPEKYPEHKRAIPNAPHENEENGKSGLKDTLPPSIQPGPAEEKIPQARNAERVSISVRVDSYRRFRNGRGGTGMNFGSPVNIICLLITLVGLAFVALYWELVTTTLVRGILIAAANLAAVLLLIAGIFVLVFLIRRFMGRGGLLRRMFR